MAYFVNPGPSVLYRRSIDAEGTHFIRRLGFLDDGIVIEDAGGRRILFTGTDGYEPRISQWGLFEMEKYSSGFGYPIEELEEIKEAFGELVRSFEP